MHELVVGAYLAAEDDALVVLRPLPGRW